MRGPMVLVGAVAVLSIAAVTGGTGPAAADGGVTLPTLPPLPTIGVPPLPLPTPSVSLPVPVPTPPAGQTPGPPGAGGGGGTGGSGAGGSGGRGGGGGGGGSSAAGDRPSSGAGGTSPAPPAAGRGTAPATGRATAARHRRDRPDRRDPVGPMVAGRPEAADVVDDESVPAVYRASTAFLRADTRIAALARLRRTMTAARTDAARAAAAYRALGGDIADARARVRSFQEGRDDLRRALVADARRSYQTGRLAADDRTVEDLVARSRRLEDAAAQAERRVAELLGEQARSRAAFEGYAATYRSAQARTARIDRALQALAAQRTAALVAARAAAPAEVARTRQTLAESGELGASISAASAALRATGRTVPGTGTFLRPSAGAVTSPFGMRFHPILHVTKLHTGTDFAPGDGYAHVADDGRVLFTVVSRAYGNFTVVDHGTIAGRHITTAYAHQARFLVHPGEVVRKGQAIGVVGATGYATGPHLHFEVRDDGVVEDPMPWLS